MSEEKLTESKRTDYCMDYCMECGEETWLLWLETFPFWSTGYMEVHATEWAWEMAVNHDSGYRARKALGDQS